VALFVEQVLDIDDFLAGDLVMDSSRLGRRRVDRAVLYLVDDLFDGLVDRFSVDGLGDLFGLGVGEVGHCCLKMKRTALANTRSSATTSPIRMTRVTNTTVE